MANYGFEDLNMTTPPDQDYHAEYRECVSYIERLHRLLLDMLKVELDAAGHTQVNNIQALLLYNLGDAETTAGELRSRGHYLGSNVSYNLKKLVEAGLMSHERSASDRRSVRVRLTASGHAIRKIVQDMYIRQGNLLKEAGVLDAEDLNMLNRALMNLEGFWQSQIARRHQ